MGKKNKVIDVVGEWTEDKHKILMEYQRAYCSIMKAQNRFKCWYIDAFAGSGTQERKKDGTFINGSPINSLKLSGCFDKYIFIEKDESKCNHLQNTVNHEFSNRPDLLTKISIRNDDSNELLVNDIIPNVKYSDYMRALCFLDPYGLHVDWEVLEAAGKSKTFDMFLNFSIMDLNMNALLKNPDKATETQRERIKKCFWTGFDYKLLYKTEGNLFGFEEKYTNDEVASVFRKGLKDIAGFIYVPKPIAMKNESRNTVYYLFFASQKDVANKVASWIFDHYPEAGHVS